jgi:hypothetical protein
MGLDRDWLFRELRRSLALLAADGDTALAGLPYGCCKPDELALDFDNFRAAVVGNFASELPPDLLATLAEVDDAFVRAPGDAWSEEAVLSHPAWAVIRERAGAALALLDRFEASR